MDKRIVSILLVVLFGILFWEIGRVDRLQDQVKQWEQFSLIKQQGPCRYSDKPIENWTARGNSYIALYTGGYMVCKRTTPNIETQ